MRRGELARTDVKLVTRAILGAANWTARWFHPEGPRSASAVAEGLAEYLVRGLAARLPKKAGRGRAAGSQART